MILVTGATGHLGGAVIQQLRQKMPVSQIAAFVRDERKAADLIEQGVTLHTGTYDDTNALDKAMQGVDKVLLVSGGDADNGIQQHQNVVDAAKKANVGCIAYTGRSLTDRDSLANQLMVRHFQTEDYIKASGLRYILFRNSLYMDTIPRFVGPTVFDRGISLPAGSGKVAFALRREQGEAMANVLAEANCASQIYNFTGAESYSFDDVAASLAHLSGKAILYTPMSTSAFEAKMKQQSIPEVITQRIIDFMTDIKQGQEEAVSSDLETVLGRKPTGLEAGLKLLYQL